MKGYGHYPKKLASQEEYEALSKTLIEASKDDDFLTILDFCLEHDVEEDYLADYSKDNATFRRALLFAKRQIKRRLTKGNMKGKIYLTNPLVCFGLWNTLDKEEQQKYREYKKAEKGEDPDEKSSQGEALDKLNSKLDALTDKISK